MMEKVYLAGAIEKAADLGKGWRTRITPILEEKGYGVLDPIDLEAEKLKGLHINRLPKGIAHWHDLKLSECQIAPPVCLAR